MTRTRQLVVMKRKGIVYPVRTMDAAARAGIPLSLACAILIQETNGGANIFGHDPTIFVGAGRVTKRKYLAYKRQRGRARMQGVGPVQLTWWATQDEADSLGGCWRPGINMLVGFRQLAAAIHAHGLHAGVASYNGSGPAAQRYADEVIAHMKTWHRMLI